MIVKELESLHPTDKRLKAGYAAEKQIAFYLRRAFAENQKLHIINGLRLKRQGDVAQIDHLICHNHGLIIVESKSVTTRVQINIHGEWSRWSGKQWQGMASPLLQAQRQADFLRKYITDIKGIKRLADWQAIPIDILIAISDNGMINRPSNQSLPGVYKAEQITDKILAIVRQRGKGDNLLNWLKVVFDDSKTTLKDESVVRLAQGLVKSHCPKPNTLSQEKSSSLANNPNVRPKKSRPIQSAAPLPQIPPLAKPRISSPVDATPTSEPSLNLSPESSTIKGDTELQPDINNGAETFNCQHCNSTNLNIVYGKYGYYFKCGDCEGNTSIKPSCGACGQRAKLRKQKLNFFVNCEACGASQLFFRNRA